MGKPNTARQIRERREKIMILMSHGYGASQIIDELKISRMTFSRDMNFINEMNNKAMFDMAKSSFSTLYMNCNDGFNALLNESWKIYKNEENDPEITPAIRMAALKLAGDIYEKKLSMFRDGPATMQLKSMHDKVEELRRDVLGLGEENVFTQRYLPSSSSSTTTNKDHNINLDDLGKP